MTRIGKNPDYTAVIYDPATGESVKTSHEGTQVSGKSNMGKWTHQGLYLHEKIELRIPQRRPPRRRVGDLLPRIGGAFGKQLPRTPANAHRDLRLRLPRKIPLSGRDQLRRIVDVPPGQAFRRLSLVRAGLGDLQRRIHGGREVDRLPETARPGRYSRTRHLRIAGTLRRLLCQKLGHQVRSLHHGLPVDRLDERLPVLRQHHFAAGQPPT